MKADGHQFFIGGLVVPLIATVGINNKVTFLEKQPSPFTNSTGAYELDISLADNFLLAWRTMHVKSNVFCSGSIILPDKGARQINVGGWSGASAQGVRIYYPDGHPGVNGTHDWEENYTELALQVCRAFPSCSSLTYFAAPEMVPNSDDDAQRKYPRRWRRDVQPGCPST